MPGNAEVDAFRRMLKLLEVTPAELVELARELGIDSAYPMAEQPPRPPCPDTMLGLSCSMDPRDMIAVGDVYSETGFNERGNMTLVISTPTRPLGAVEITREQAKALRDFLNKKLGD